MPAKPDYPIFHFHISGVSRKKYGFKETSFSMKGQTVFTNYQAALRFTALFNKGKPAEEQMKSAHFNALALMDEVLHYIIEQYRRQINPNMLQELESEVIKNLGGAEYHNLMEQFTELFPDSQVYNGEQTVSAYLKGKSGDLPNTQVALEEMMTLWLDNSNPAYKVINELIDDQALRKKTKYNQLPAIFNAYLKKQPTFGPDKLSLWEMLQQPAKKYPLSIYAQMEFIHKSWKEHIKGLNTIILLSMDYIHEEEKARFDPGIFGPGPAEVTDYSAVDEYEPEAFSEDMDWTSHLTLIAKSVYVWLDQLSNTYQRDIGRLDQIPDEELRRLAGYGFTGIWLIGLWERSVSSKKIKQINGNPQAAASAYSLKNYQIAQDLGGEKSHQNLKERAAKYGLRLAGDMVPNHMGIDSDWVINHPDWFIQRSSSPFPSYTFNGPDLSEDERVGLFIEDGYWNHSDAAVVFKRLDRHTGDVRYIYHGNDGTGMPWNDTAQLDYLIPEVREAVIQTILHVARKFPIIRFDAAMTLAKKHCRRLWYPEPGKGGDIPSRAEYAMTKEKFDEAFPIEFWREVVDRVAQEAPDTLLLAEAFWMMEGYFVRTLGMHRVYNSAFMNMLKNEDNANYRLSIKNTLEYNPQILKRYANFMNNPDEDAAVAQFGKDDKYFGVCLMMSAMPGLPMFGHGQIEGFAEKYGMEYRKAYWDEQPDQKLIERHEREIFPILKKRYLFSDVDDFYLYDFYSDGQVNEDVFAFSNRSGDERALALYHNKFAEAKGWINQSAAFNDGDGLRQVALWQGLGVSKGKNNFVCFRDHISGLEFIRSGKEISERGLYIELGAFKYHIFWDFREVADCEDEPWARLTHELNGEGVLSLNNALHDMINRPVLFPFSEAVNEGVLNWLSAGFENGRFRTEAMETYRKKTDDLIKAVIKFEKLDANKLKPADSIDDYKAALYLTNLPESGFDEVKSLNKNVVIFINEFLLKTKDDRFTRLQILFIILFTKTLRRLYDNHSQKSLRQRFFMKRGFSRIIEKTTPEKQRGNFSNNLSLLIEVIANMNELQYPKKEISSYIENLLSNPLIRNYLKTNHFEGVVYFNKERFDELLNWIFTMYAVQKISSTGKRQNITAIKLNDCFRAIHGLKKQAELYGYRYDDFINNLLQDSPASGSNSG